VESFYLDIRAVHIAAVIVSGSLFILRSAGHNFSNARWPMAFPLRTIVWSVDTVLLTAALMLMTIVQQYPFVDGWLTMKVLLLVIYILLGRLAFAAERRSTRLWSMGAAIAVYLFIVTIARAHSPLGIFSAI
jgi:uncharacterized membrane protein SirB2